MEAFEDHRRRMRHLCHNPLFVLCRLLLDCFIQHVSQLSVLSIQFHIATLKLLLFTVHLFSIGLHLCCMLLQFLHFCDKNPFILTIFSICSFYFLNSHPHLLDFLFLDNHHSVKFSNLLCFILQSDGHLLESQTNLLIFECNLLFLLESSI